MQDKESLDRFMYTFIAPISWAVALFVFALMFVGYLVLQNNWLS